MCRASVSGLSLRRFVDHVNNDPELSGRIANMQVHFERQYPSGEDTYFLVQRMRVFVRNFHRISQITRAEADNPIAQQHLQALHALDRNELEAAYNNFQSLLRTLQQCARRLQLDSYVLITLEQAAEQVATMEHILVVRGELSDMMDVREEHEFALIDIMNRARPWRFRLRRQRR